MREVSRGPCWEAMMRELDMGGVEARKKRLYEGGKTKGRED